MEDFKQYEDGNRDVIDPNVVTSGKEDDEEVEEEDEETEDFEDEGEEMCATVQA